MTYLCQAGDKAVELSAYREGGAFFEQALQALKHLPQDPERIRQGIDIRLKLRPIIGATANYDRLEHCLAEAETLATSIDDRPRLAAINVARSFVHNWRGELDASIECGLRARNIAREIGDRAVDVGASFYLGQAYMWRGDFRQSVAVLEDNLAWIDGPLRHQRIGTTGTGSVLWLGMLGASHGRLGNFEAAIDAARKACLIADEVQRPYDIALAYWWAGFIWSHKGDVPQALQALEHGFEVCRASQINYLVPILSTSLGYTYALAGTSRRRNTAAYEGRWHSLAPANSLMGKPGRVHTWVLPICSTISYEGMLDHARSVLELARKHKYRAIEADALRLLGDDLSKRCRTGSGRSRAPLSASLRDLPRTRVAAGIRRAARLVSGKRLCNRAAEAEAERLFDSASQLCRSMGLVAAGRSPRPPGHSQFILNRIGKLLGPPMKIDAERRGRPAISIDREPA